jgi:hypothetical protein
VPCDNPPYLANCSVSASLRNWLLLPIPCATFVVLMTGCGIGVVNEIEKVANPVSERNTVRRLSRELRLRSDRVGHVSEDI